MPNPFDDPDLISGCQEWYTGRGRRADRQEKRLLTSLLADLPHAETVLEVGCGTGHFTRWFADQGKQAVGVDVSTGMLAEASKRNGLHYFPGDALALPFTDRSFDLVALITTLEFVAEPQRALTEAVRVARVGLILGAINRRSLLALKRKAARKPPWNSARFLSVPELTRLVRAAAGKRLTKIHWRTTLWPISGLGSLPLPWGGFIGMTASLDAN